MPSEKKIVFTISHFSEGYQQWSWHAWLVGGGWTISSKNNNDPCIRGYTTSNGGKRGFKRWARRWYPKYELIYIETMKLTEKK